MKFAFLFFFFSSFLLANNPRIWENASQQDFAKGTFINTVLLSDGTILSGKQTKMIQSSELTLWCHAMDSKGNLFIGTGVAGRIYRLENNALQLYCDTGELIVTSLVITASDEMYASTLPKGKIFQIQNGQATLLTQLPASSPYIWGMKLREKKLLAGTGPEGLLWEIDLDSKQSSILLKTTEKHLLSIDIDPENNIYLGSAPNGILYQVTPFGKTIVLASFPENEIRCLAFAGSKMYVGLNSTKKFDNATMVQNLSKRLEQQSKGKPLDRKKLLEEMVAGMVYEFSPKGWEKLLDLPKNFITCLAPVASGVVVGTGLEGFIYEIQDRENFSLIHDLKEDQIMSLVVGGGKLQYFGTGDTGCLYQVKDNFSSIEAQYLSEVHDCETWGEWNLIYWEYSGRLMIQTRTGNTKTPDEFWSDWSSWQSSGYSYVRIKSPASRYFQYKVAWEEADAALKMVRVVYSRQNRSPEITEFKMEFPAENPRNLYMEKPLNPIKFTWRAKDPDGEKVRYRLFYKNVQSNCWYEMTANTILTDTTFKWETSQVADGLYFIKFVASDDLENTTPRPAIRITRPIIIDNHPPMVNVKKVGKELKGTAIDHFSMIVQIAYRINEGEWTLLEAADKLCDQKEEEFTLDVPSTHLESFTIQIRALDAAGNAGYVFYPIEKAE